MNKENHDPIRYSAAELEEFRQIILSKLQKAKEECANITRLIMGDSAQEDTELDRQFNDMIDESASHAQRMELNRLLTRQTDFIEKLKAALVRIDNGTYGICRATGKLIPKERLKAVPHATLSVEGKMKK